MIFWTTLIKGYMQIGQSQQALECFQDMQHKGIRPNAVTYLCILKAGDVFGAANKGKQIHDKDLRQGLPASNVLLGDALVDTWSIQSHYKFVSKLCADVKQGMTTTLIPRAHIVDPEDTIIVFGNCVACGKPLEALYMVGTFMLPRKHQYQPLCFAVMLGIEDMCVKGSCNTAIHSKAKAWVSERTLLKSRGSFCADTHDNTSVELKDVPSTKAAS
ncbi:hypothetical protein L7F22_066897 [Adiantum nelumboides]|nr:hypothetical protein [Adiantum nelumboides]